MPFVLEKEPDDPGHVTRGFHLPRGALHEFYASAEGDGASLCALAMLLAETGGKRFGLWVRHEAQEREAGMPYPAGLAELGLDPGALLYFRAREVISALQAGLEGAGCSGLAAVILEFRGEAKAYDLTASRRLGLAARASGVPVLVLRIGAAPVPSAAETRWQIRAMPSQALPAKAPGRPAFQLTLLRARNGLEGVQHHLEWDRDARQFISRPRHDAAFADQGAPPRHAPLSGPVVPVPFDRPGVPQPWREAG
jgi:protein ImuA